MLPKSEQWVDMSTEFHSCRHRFCSSSPLQSPRWNASRRTGRNCTSIIYQQFIPSASIFISTRSSSFSGSSIRSVSLVHTSKIRYKCFNNWDFVPSSVWAVVILQNVGSKKHVGAFLHCVFDLGYLYRYNVSSRRFNHCAGKSWEYHPRNGSYL